MSFLFSHIRLKKVHLYCEKKYLNKARKVRCTFRKKRLTNGFQASTIATYDFSTLYTTVPHYLIRNKRVDLIEITFRQEEVLYLACDEERAFFLLMNIKYMIDRRTCQKVTDAFIYLLDNIYIRFGSKLYRQNV